LAAGSFSNGFQSPWLRRSLISGKILSGGAWITVVRAVRNVFGLVAA
jgi:hypothetical protein